jgi:hypothetical protein
MIMALYIQRLTFQFVHFLNVLFFRSTTNVFAFASHIPPNETIVSSFLPLGGSLSSLLLSFSHVHLSYTPGPTGLGGFSALKLGAVAVHLLPLRAASSNHQFPEFAGVALWGFGLVLAMLLWGLGVWFGLIAVAGFAWRAREGNLRFNVSRSIVERSNQRQD